MADNLKYLMINDYTCQCMMQPGAPCAYDSTHECEKCCNCLSERHDIPTQPIIHQRWLSQDDEVLSDATDYYDEEEERAPFMSPLLKPQGLVRHDARLVFDDSLSTNPLAIKRKAPEEIELFKAGGKLSLEFPPLTVAPAIAPLENPIIGLNGDDDELFDPDTDEEEREAKQSLKKVKDGRGPCVQRWIQTYNNPTITGDELFEQLKANEKIKGCAFQLEKGANGTPHFQMYIEFKQQQFCTAVYKALGTRAVFTEPAKGTKHECIKYCTKEDTRVGDKSFVFGTCADGSAGPGARTDVTRFQKALVEKGEVDLELVNQYPRESLTYIKQAQALVSLLNYQKARTKELEKWQEQVQLKAEGKKYGLKPRELILYFGPSAVGKTTNAYLEVIRRFNELPYKKQGKTKWWDYYVKEKAVVCDEWQKDLTGNIETFNDMTNEGVYMAECKGGQVQMVAEVIYFTTNRHPRDIYNVKWNDGVYRAMVRRFAEVHWWNDDKQLTVLKNPGEKPAFLGDEDTQPEMIEWNQKNDAWVHFWKGKTVQEGTVIINENGQMTSNDELYFTW